MNPASRRGRPVESGVEKLTVRCSCGKTISVAAEHRGRRIRCKQCGRELRVHGGPRLPAVLEPALRLLTLGYAAAILLLTAVLWGLGDAWWPATLLLYIGRWVFLLPLIVLLPTTLVFRRRLAVPLAVAALVCVGPLMGGRVGLQRLLPHPAGTRVRVMTFNADGGDPAAMLLPGYLEVWRPDFVALQECGQRLQAVIDKLPGWYHHHVRQQCFLSRYPLVDSMVMDRHVLEQLKQSSVDIGGAGDVARYTVRMPQGLVSFTNLHLETPRKGLEGALRGTFNAAKLDDNTELRRIESDLAVKWVRAGKGPAIVAGDFNMPVESRIFQEYWGDFTDAFSYAGFGFGMTKLNGWIRVRIDHVLVGDGWYPERVEVGDGMASDHLPVIVDLTLTPGK